LLVVWRIRIAPLLRKRPRALATRVLGMEDDLRAAGGGPSDGLRVSPALVTDRDAELRAADLEETASASGHVERLLARVEPDLGREAEEPAALVDDRRRDPAAVRVDPLDSEDDRRAVAFRLAAHLRERALLLRFLPGQDFEILAAQARQVRLGKAHDHG